MPNDQLREEMIKNLMELNPKFIATGHGPCIKLQQDYNEKIIEY
ncbi:hypothetical protein [Clostridium sp. OS1-26]|nr:hypothetical protein [Clostridium sp. OS1-26]WML32738.1 hypothetical protein RCG18_15320 [Clostridium sp. OS1-26]